MRGLTELAPLAGLWPELATGLVFSCLVDAADAGTASFYDPNLDRSSSDFGRGRG
jgi:hypothetical protein